jgi:hypothetical protein
VVHARKLKEWLRKEGRGSALPRELQAALEQILPRGEE